MCKIQSIIVNTLNLFLSWSQIGWFIKGNRKILNFIILVLSYYVFHCHSDMILLSVIALQLCRLKLRPTQSSCLCEQGSLSSIMVIYNLVFHWPFTRRQYYFILPTYCQCNNRLIVQFFIDLSCHFYLWTCISITVLPCGSWEIKKVKRVADRKLPQGELIFSCFRSVEPYNMHITHPLQDLYSDIFAICIFFSPHILEVQ